MVRRADVETKPRGRPKGGPLLSQDRILETALSLADDRGIDDMSMRRLAHVLGVEGMSLYNHVADKSDLLDGLVDIVFSEVDVPTGDREWRAELRKWATSAREEQLHLRLRPPGGQLAVQDRVRIRPRRDPQCPGAHPPTGLEPASPRCLKLNDWIRCRCLNSDAPHVPRGAIAAAGVGTHPRPPSAQAEGRSDGVALTNGWSRSWVSSQFRVLASSRRHGCLGARQLKHLFGW
jgi:AcrR family transcriptional regulator